MNHRHGHGGGGSDATPRRAKRVWIGVAAVAAVFLWTENRAHLLGVLPFLLLLACPLMHFFMHGSHGGDAQAGGQNQHKLTVDGLYAQMRHPQYVAFVVIMFGFLLQWPTLTTLAMLPVLVFMYARLARQEEQASAVTFGDACRKYMARTPAFTPAFAGARPRAG